MFIAVNIATLVHIYMWNTLVDFVDDNNTAQTQRKTDKTDTDRYRDAHMYRHTHKIHIYL